MDDLNYNSKVTFDDGTSALIFINKLNNEGLNYWQGWKCRAGSTGIFIYKDQVYGGECRNDRLGDLMNGWELLTDYTVCTQTRCFGCTIDMLQEKHKVTDQ